MIPLKMKIEWYDLVGMCNHFNNPKLYDTFSVMFLFFKDTMLKDEKCTA